VRSFVASESYICFNSLFFCTIFRFFFVVFLFISKKQIQYIFFFGVIRLCVCNFFWCQMSLMFFILFCGLALKLGKQQFLARMIYEVFFWVTFFVAIHDRVDDVCGFTQNCYQQYLGSIVLDSSFFVSFFMCFYFNWATLKHLLFLPICIYFKSLFAQLSPTGRMGRHFQKVCMWMKFLLELATTFGSSPRNLMKGNFMWYSIKKWQTFWRLTVS